MPSKPKRSKRAPNHVTKADVPEQAISSSRSSSKATEPRSASLISPSGEVSASPQQSSKSTAAWWIKLLVLFHVVCITVWCCPQPLPEIESGKVKPFGSDWIIFWNQKYLKGDLNLASDTSWPGPVPSWTQQYISDPIQLYLFTTGTWQYWDMFAPNPANMDWWMDAVVTYRDGSKKVYQYPRMYLLSLPEKYVKERYRKFFERAHVDDYQYLFPPVAQRIALLNYNDPRNPPVKVALRRHWLGIEAAGTPQPTTYNSYNYFT